VASVCAGACGERMARVRYDGCHVSNGQAVRGSAIMTSDVNASTCGQSSMRDEHAVAQSRSLPAEPVVSIVVPVFNGARYVNQAIDSLLAQSYPGCEIVVVDDGSTDDTLRRVKTYGDQVKVVALSHVGQSGALNAGWQRSSGTVLSYLSCDDRLLPHAVERAVAELRARPDVVAVYGSYRLIDPASRVLGVVNAGKFDYEDMLLRGRCAPGPGAFVRRAAHLRVGGWATDLRQMPDLDYWLRLGLIGPLQHISEILAEFREHPDSASFRAVEVGRADEPIRIYERFFSSSALPARYARHRSMAVAHAHLLAARAHARARRFTLCLARLRTAFTTAPILAVSPWALRLLMSGLFGEIKHRRRWSRGRR
jgi:glycosyltransferase involved in cell wall biosynthesis